MIYKYVILLLSIVKCSNPLCTGNSSYSAEAYCDSNQYLGQNWTCNAIPQKYNGAKITKIPVWNTTFNCSQTFSTFLSFNCSGYGVLNSWNNTGLSATPNGIIDNEVSCIDIPVIVSNSSCKAAVGYDTTCEDGYGMVEGIQVMNNTSVFEDNYFLCCPFNFNEALGLSKFVFLLSFMSAVVMT
jgi:hypothetical protein